MKLTLPSAASTPAQIHVRSSEISVARASIPKRTRAVGPIAFGIEVTGLNGAAAAAILSGSAVALTRACPLSARAKKSMATAA